MNKQNTLIGMLVMICSMLYFNSIAQISPGDLCGSHAHLEGMTNCTLCHILGEKVSNEKCLNCHKELKTRMDQQKGFHVSTEVFGKECVSCHNDHHGRKFEVIRFQKDKFDHRQTGYILEGAHAKKECQDCHKKEYITNAEIRGKKFQTYLGLSTDCLSCHADYHQKSLSSNCLNCHDYEAFKPASKFDHNNAKYKLVGKHTTVVCLNCHKKIQKAGKEFQLFTGLKFDNCVACHTDAHNNKFGQDCRQCHTEQSFHDIKGMKNFDHDKTNFKLEEKHKAVTCLLCHKSGLTGPLNHTFCSDCHTDYHEKQFAKDGLSPDCAACHTVAGFESSSYSVEQHALSSYPLTGSHVKTACIACHKKQEKWRFRQIGTQCADCHTDYHQKQFVKLGKSPDCAECHTVNSFKGSSYSLEKHALSSFPLKGAHIATPCFVCHKKQEKWSFRQIGLQCADCHDDIHKPFLIEKYYPASNCKACHLENRWPEVSFDHSKTAYPLEGAHKNQDCRACHFKAGLDGKTHQQFKDLPQLCTYCHNDSHRNQFDKAGVTDCMACHNYVNWEVRTFDHDKTKFKLEGKHEGVACKDCHKETYVGGSPFVLYKITKFKCEDCHH